MTFATAPAVRIRPSSTQATGIAGTQPRQGILAALDALGECIGLYDAKGTALEYTSSLRGLLTARADRDDLLPLIAAAIEALSEQAEGARRVSGSPAAVRVKSGGFRVGASLCRSAGEPVILVHVARAPRVREVNSDEEIVGRFGLTPKELRVARLISDGKSNKSVAEAMHISVHTARHHTERVLQKLGIRSRQQVARHLLAEP